MRLLLTAFALAGLVNLVDLILRIWGPVFADPEVARIGDFAAFWAAAKLALSGTAPSAYDWATLHAAQEAGYGVAIGTDMPWFHPPPAFLAVAPLGLVDPWTAIWLWVLITGALYLRVAWAILPGWSTLLAALGASPTVYTASTGQMGFLTAAIMGTGLLWLSEGRQRRAGAALAMLAIKPPLALAVPVTLLFGRRWRAIGWGITSGAMLVVLATLLAGPEVWGSWLQASETAVALFRGDTDHTPRWSYFVSPYGALRALGFDYTTAITLHVVQGAAVLAALALAVTRGAGPTLLAALTAYACVLVSPRIYVYDAHLLVIGALFQIRHACTAGWFRAEAWILAAALMAGFVSQYALPGPAILAPPLLFWSAFLGHRAHRKS